MTRVCLLLTVQAWNERRIFRRQAPALASSGFDVELVCAEPDPQASGPMGVNLVPICARDRRLARVTGSLNLLSRFLSLKPDVLEVTCVEQLPLGIALKLLSPTRVVYDCREDHVSSLREHRDGGSALARALVPLAIAALQRIGDRLFDGLIASDESIVRLHARVPPNRAMIYWNYPQLSLFPASYPPHRERPFDIAMMGSMSLRVGMDSLFEAVGRLAQRGRRVKVLLIGLPLSSPTKEACEGIIARYGIEDQVTATGVLDHTKVAAALAQAKIGIAPHKDFLKFRRNVACKVFEYMAAGMASLCSDLPPQRAFVREGVHGRFFKPGDPADLANVLDEMLRDPEGTEAMGRRGREAIESEWNCERQDRDLVAFFRALTGQAGASTPDPS